VERVLGRQPERLPADDQAQHRNLAAEYVLDHSRLHRRRRVILGAGQDHVAGPNVLNRLVAVRRPNRCSGGKAADAQALGEASLAAPNQPDAALKQPAQAD
jgi:hypothetical protein